MTAFLKGVGATCILLLWPALLTFPVENGEERSVVLVTGVYSPISPLNPGKLKKLFLGVPVFSNGTRIIPLRNFSDKLLHEVFLQKVVHMSADMYEKQLKVANNHVFMEMDQLLQALIQERNTVSYMWLSIAQTEPRLKIIQTLWKGRL